MEIEVMTRSKTLQEVIKPVALFYAKDLNILKSKYKIYIVTHPSLRSQGSNGLCSKTGVNEITIALYSRLKATELLQTLAHEMVHAKQFCRGQLKQEPMKYGSGVHSYWRGKRVKTDYLNRPWEIEAFAREGLLLEKLNAFISKKIKKVKK